MLKSLFLIALSAFLLIGESVVNCQKSGKLVPTTGGINSNKKNGSLLSSDGDELMPTVLIAMLVRNKGHTLPYVLTLLEKLDYPKERISFWIKSDHNEDNSAEILRAWAEDIQDWGKYHSVSVEIIDGPPFRHDDQETPVEWTSKRYQHIMRLKEEAVKVARKIWADYVWFIDADVFITNNQTLKRLVSKKKDVVAPFLQSGGMYSNFWGGMQDYYYIRTEEYKEILEQKKEGCFPVPLIHSCVLMNVKKNIIPNYNRPNESVPEDDIIIFAVNAQDNNITMEICNDLEYGYVVSPLEDETHLYQDINRLHNLRVEIASYWTDALEVSEVLQPFLPTPQPPSTIGFDQVYIINLKRRPDRLARTINKMDILGIDWTLIDGVDGSELTEESVAAMGIKQLEEYRDPYSGRMMTFGEIGCFLSHYKIWEQMVKQHVNTALVLEDDVRFEPFFVYQVQRVFEEAAKLYLDWDLVYLGRKRSQNAKEPWVNGSQYLVHVDYSYWTLGYAITLRGAKKLLDAKPLEKLVPVDEYLPIMFDRHHNVSWKMAYPTRNLLAFSTEPLLMFPTHYTSEPGYISDTERSSIIALGNCTAASGASKCSLNRKDEL